MVPLTLLWTTAALVFYYRKLGEGAILCGIIAFMGWMLVLGG